MNKNFYLRLAMVTLIIAVSINTITCKKSENSPSSENTASPSSQRKATVSPVNAWLKASGDGVIIKGYNGSLVVCKA